jgi:hypothetical protein
MDLIQGASHRTRARLVSALKAADLSSRFRLDASRKSATTTASHAAATKIGCARAMEEIISALTEGSPMPASSDVSNAAPVSPVVADGGAAAPAPAAGLIADLVIANYVKPVLPTH